MACSSVKMASKSGCAQGQGDVLEDWTDANRKAWEIEQAWSLLEQSSPTVYAMRNGWRQQRYEQQGGRCLYCRQPLIRSEALAKMPNSLTLDHVIPLAKGGPDTFDNTVAACHACNQAKGMLDLGEFSTHPIRLQRLTAANTPPERLSADEKSPYYSKAALDREVRVFFNERERFDVHEYSVTEKWILVPAGKSKNRFGQPLLIKLRGHIRVQYPSELDDLLRAGALDFPPMSAASLEQGG